MPRKFLLLVSVILLAVAAGLGYRVADGIWRDFYWTPKELALSPEQARTRVEIYLADALVQSSTLSQPVRIRLNNVAEATRVPLASAAFCLGAGLAFLVAGLASPRSRR